MIQGAFNRILDILKNNNKLIIPDLQRDYCWGTVLIKGKKEEQKSLVYNFTRELIAEAERGVNYKEFSYGIIYAYEYPRTFLNLCDGQQRLTTLYLILGVLNCYEENKQVIGILRLPNCEPRLKYEIRNSTDYFIKDLVSNVFLNQDLTSLGDLSNTTWFREEYNDDPSIKNLVAAIKDIERLINQNNYKAIVNFVLEKVGFVYIKLEANDATEHKSFMKIREYGEKMYEIVNTCGDPMEINEHRKSIVLADVPVENRKEWTEKWESWQDFFWLNKGNNYSADEGFNAFLQWIEEIEKATDYSIELVEEYFKAFFVLVSMQDEILKIRSYQIVNIKAEFLLNQKPKLAVLYPCLVYLKNTNSVKYVGSEYKLDKEQINFDELFRFIRFFSNISKYKETVDNNVQLAKLNMANGDVVNFLKVEVEQLNITLANDERFKLRIIKDCKNEEMRKDLEDKIWAAEDNVYFNGNISPLFEWLGLDITSVIQDKFCLIEFDKFYRLFCQLMTEECIEKLRITFLALSDNFSDFQEGWSWGAERYYLGTTHHYEVWRSWIKMALFKTIFMRVIVGENVVAIIEKALLQEPDIKRKTAISFLFNKGQEHWQWRNNKRFFIFQNKICFPNGSQAKANTEEVEIF